MSRVHAFDDDDALGHHDAVGLAAELAARRVGIPEVVEAAIARTERVDAELGAVAHRAYERARSEAAHPRGGFFAGVPTFIKDNTDVAGMPSTWGSDAFVARPAARDGDPARMLMATGLLPLGKTRLSEFGFNASCEHPRSGPVRSPWDTERTAGASSSGSAALVAAGAVPIAHANDGGGSIRIPAAVNGLVGLKPTRGRTPSDPVSASAPVQVVSEGVLTRSVRDTAALMRESERIWRNRALPPIGDVTGPGRARLRIGLVTDSVVGLVDPYLVEQVREVAGLLEHLGHHVEAIEVPAPAGFERDFVLYWGLLSLVLTTRGRRLLGPDFDRSRVDNLTRGLAAHARADLAHLPGAIRRLRRSSDEAARWHSRYDLMLMPTVAGPTPRLGVLDPTQPYEQIIENLVNWVTFTPLQNANGTPAISLPLARDAEGAPMGVMLSAGQGQEARLLEVAFELEAASRIDRIDS